VAVNRAYAIAVKYFHRNDSCSLAALHIAELLLVISSSFNSLRRTDRSTELSTLLTLEATDNDTMPLMNQFHVLP